MVFMSRACFASKLIDWLLTELESPVWSRCPGRAGMDVWDIFGDWPDGERRFGRPEEGWA